MNLIELISWLLYNKWEPNANVESSNRLKLKAYKIAAERLGIKIRLGKVVPCSAGKARCLGMTGIWILKEDTKKLKRHQFTDEMWKAYAEEQNNILTKFFVNY